MKRKIEFYRTDKICPIEEFFDELDDNVIAKIVATLKYIEELVIVPGKILKKLNKEIELAMKYKSEYIGRSE